MRILKNGNEYRLIKPYTTEDGKTIDTGQICQYNDGYLMTCDSTNTYVRFKAELVPDDDLLLYNETPYNREYRERRERIATAAMQAILNGMTVNTLLMEQMAQRAARLKKSLGGLVAFDAVGYADELIKELIKQGDVTDGINS